jgi:outer membrane receptor protein involved in Fe transport
MKKTLQPKLIVVAILAAYAMPHAAWAANKAEALELGKVEVVGTTPLAGVGVPVEQVPSNVQVVKGSEIQNQQSLGVADFMNQNLSGVNINEAQNNPYQPDVNFRGFTASPLAGTPQGLSVYQDGVRINEPFADTVNWDLIPQNAISSMTLMPGSNPLFGLNTLGGALSLQTKSGEHYPGGGLQVLGGSFGRWAVEGEYGGKTADGVSYFFAGNKFEENGWRDASPSDVLQGFAKLGWSNEKTDVDISFSGADTDLTGNGFQAQSLLGQAGGYDSIYTKPDNTQNQLSFVNSKVSHWLSDELLLSTNAYFRRNKTKTLNGDVNDEYETLYTVCADSITTLSNAECEANFDHGVINRSNATNKSFGGTVQTSWVNDRNLLVTGMSIDLGRVGFMQTEQEAEEFNAARGFDLASYSANPVETAVDLSAKSRTWSLFATDTFAVTPKLAFTVSARYNHTHLKVTDKRAALHEGSCMLNAAAASALGGGAAAGDVVDCETESTDRVEAALGTDPNMYVVTMGGGDAGGTHNYSRLNPAVGMTYAFTPETNTYFGYNEGSRAPSPIETGCADPLHPCLLPNAMAGDPPLQQVVAKTFEGGFRGKLGQDTRWSLGAYRAVNHNDLQFIASGVTGAGYFDNVGKTRRQGLDLALNSKVGSLSWAAGYSLVDATYQDTFSIVSEANSSRRSVNGVKQITVSKGNKMAGIAKHQFKLRGQLQATPNWSIGTTGVAFSDQYARGNENNQHVALSAADSFDGNAYNGSGKVKGYAILNLDSRYNFNSSGWQLFAKVNNVFDRKYYTSGLLGENSFNGAGNAFATDAESTKEMFLAPGAPRAAWIGMRYDFGKPKGIAAAVDAD